MLYLLRINKNYYFRLRVPLDMKRHFNQREIKKTLHTTCYNFAKSLVKKYIAEAERVFNVIRSGVLDEAMIQEISNNYKESLIQNHDFDRNLGTLSDKRQIKSAKEQEIRMINRMLATDIAFYERTLSEIDEGIKCNQMKLGLRRGYKDNSIIEDVDSALNSLNVNFDKDSLEYKNICNEVLKAKISANIVIREHLSGNFDTDYDV